MRRGFGFAAYNAARMSPVNPLGPFRPGFGGQPPYLAGREEEQRLLRRYLDALAAGVAPGTAVVLYGPRGNGKTVLLGWLQREAARTSGVGAATLQPAAAPNEERLRDILAPRSWWRRLAAGGIGVAGFSGKLGEGRRPPVEEILAARATREPLLLLVDEAHTLDLAVGQVLLNASQQVSGERPFLLVLAGTPNLEGRLNAMGASFWNRAAQIRVGRLSEAATAEAFRRPFEDEGTPVEEEVLGGLARESQRYPYFVQLLGQAVWREQQSASGGAREVSSSRVEKALPRFERVRGEYYAQRLEELTERELLPVGRAVAEAFYRRDLLNRGELEDAIRSGLGDAAGPEQERAAWRGLLDLGYLWRVEARPEWEPGIPSLMDYVRRHAPGQ